ncbi:DUF4387 family protein [Hippea jasoniae]|uniref:DUF4387 family protein n=1 Tax=Hippea jasoniae TaxID=944479 RepID=UPI00054FE450|nr:DUF4387 family protein [Hippea jasoniae]
MKLKDSVVVLRSKNAGVWHITIDIIFKNSELYKKWKAKLTEDFFKKLYKRDVRFFYCDDINTIKVSFLRDVAAGGIGDRDCLGANFYIPLMEIEL